MVTVVFTRRLLCYGPDPSWCEKQPEDCLIRMSGIWISEFCSGDHPSVALLGRSRTCKDLDYFMNPEAKEKPQQVGALACSRGREVKVTRSRCSGGSRTEQEGRTQVGSSAPPTAVLTSNRYAFQGYLFSMSLSSGHIGCLPSLDLSRTKVAAIPFIFFLSRHSVYSLVLIFCWRRCKQSSPRIWLAFLLSSWSLWMKRSSHPILYWLARVAWSATLQRDLSVSWLSRNERHDLLEASDNEESPQVHQFTVLE